MPWQSEVIKKEAMAKFNICTGNIALGYRANFANSAGTLTSSNTSRYSKRKIHKDTNR